MPDISKFALNKDLRPGESVCYCGRVTALRRALGVTYLSIIIFAFLIYASVEKPPSPGEMIFFISMSALLVALRWSIPRGEVIITDQRILSKFNNQKTTDIPLKNVKISLLIDHMNFQYYRMTLSDHSVYRIFMAGDHEAFANCLPKNVRVYKSAQDVKGGKTLRGAVRGVPVFGMLAGLGLGMLTLYGLVEVFDGMTENEFWSLIIVCLLLFGPMIAVSGFGSLLGITLAFAFLKNNLTLDEAKAAAIYGLALDFGAPPGNARLTTAWLASHLERTLSKAYGQTVRL